MEKTPVFLIENEATEIHTPDSCLAAMKAVQDSLYVINGKWKLPIIISLTFGNKRFTEIARDIPRITDRMLSKELQELELNMLVERIQDEASTSVTRYKLTTYGKTLDPAIQELYKWGINHREKIKEE